MGREEDEVVGEVADCGSSKSIELSEGAIELSEGGCSWSVGTSTVEDISCWSVGTSRKEEAEGRICWEGSLVGCGMRVDESLGVEYGINKGSYEEVGSEDEEDDEELKDMDSSKVRLVEREIFLVDEL